MAIRKGRCMDLQAGRFRLGGTGPIPAGGPWRPCRFCGDCRPDRPDRPPRGRAWFCGRHGPRTLGVAVQLLPAGPAARWVEKSGQFGSILT